MTDAVKRATRALVEPVKRAAGKATAPLYDNGEDTPSFSKAVTAVVVAIWVLTILARVVVALAPHEGTAVAAPGFTWQDVAIIALVIVASYGRSMVRTLLHRTSIGIGNAGGASNEPARRPSGQGDVMLFTDRSVPTFAKTKADNIFTDDERGDFREREIVD